MIIPFSGLLVSTRPEQGVPTHDRHHDNSRPAGRHARSSSWRALLRPCPWLLIGGTALTLHHSAERRCCSPRTGQAFRRAAHPCAGCCVYPPSPDRRMGAGAAGTERAAWSRVLPWPRCAAVCWWAVLAAWFIGVCSCFRDARHALVLCILLQQQVQGHMLSAHRLHEVLEQAAVGWFLLPHKNPAEWILMQNGRRAVATVSDQGQQG